MSEQDHLRDVELMNAALEGDEQAFGELVENRHATLLNFLRSMGVPSSELEDLAQEVWIKLYDYRFRYRATARFTTFLYTVAKQKLIDSFRVRGRRRDAMDRFRVSREHEEEQRQREGLSIDHHPDLGPALEAIGSEHREVLILRTREQLSYKEIAEMIGIPVGTVKSRMHHAIKAMKEALHDES